MGQAQTALNRSRTRHSSSHRRLQHSPLRCRHAHPLHPPDSVCEARLRMLSTQGQALRPSNASCYPITGRKARPGRRSYHAVCQIARIMLRPHAEGLLRPRHMRHTALAAGSVLTCGRRLENGLLSAYALLLITSTRPRDCVTPPPCHMDADAPRYAQVHRASCLADLTLRIGSGNRPRQKHMRLPSRLGGRARLS